MKKHLGNVVTLVSATAVAVSGYELSTTESTSSLKRKLIFPHASGNILETCCGQGQNLSFYDVSKVHAITLVDSNAEALFSAQQSLPPLWRDQKHKIHMVQSSTLEKFDNDSFDTVVDTWGICSIEKDPQQYVAEMNRVLKPGGLALFLEHGRAEEQPGTPLLLSQRVVNTFLDFFAPFHFRYRGCTWNHDMRNLIITSGGFEIIKQESLLFGTNTWILARKKRE